MSFILNSTHSLISLLCNGFWSFFNPNLFIIHRYKHLTTSDGVLSIYILIYTFFLLWISFYFFTILFGHSIEFYTLYEQIISSVYFILEPQEGTYNISYKKRALDLIESTAPALESFPSQPPSSYRDQFFLKSRTEIWNQGTRFLPSHAREGNTRSHHATTSQR